MRFWANPLGSSPPSARLCDLSGVMRATAPGKTYITYLS
jgi:hypothetical protein